jgi:hypothetical protein
MGWAMARAQLKKVAGDEEKKEKSVDGEEMKLRYLRLTG